MRLVVNEESNFEAGLSHCEGLPPSARPFWINRRMAARYENRLSGRPDTRIPGS